MQLATSLASRWSRINSKSLGWEVLNAVREAPFIRSMYVWIFSVPVVVKAFQKTEDVVWVEIFGAEFRLHLSLPFSWQVFFWCAVSFGLANLLTLVFAPKIIKENKSFDDFQRAGKGDVHLSQYASDLKRSHTAYRWDSFAATHEIQWDNYRAFLKEKFWEFYSTANMERPYIRGVCSICYMLGFGLLGWLVCSNIFWVLTYLYF